MLKVNGINIATPSSFKVSVMDIDASAERNAQGDLQRDRVATKRKLEMSYKTIKSSNLSTLLKAIKDETFTVTYPDPVEGTSLTKTFYVGDRVCPMYNFALGLWTDVNFNFVEV